MGSETIISEGSQEALRDASPLPQRGSQQTEAVRMERLSVQSGQHGITVHGTLSSGCFNSVEHHRGIPK